jgi:peptidoglycan/LPS O-acetylase OafA/YrhL
MGQSDASTKFTLVQALRGIAALWVVLFHAAEGKHLEAIRAAAPAWLFDSVFEAGHFGVSIFFALSGFVIAHSLRNADATPRFAGKFILRRSIRLDPPYWATIALVIAQQALEARIKGTAISDVSAAQIAAHVFYLTDVLGYPQITSVFWTLCFEIQFYLGFVVLLMVERFLSRRFGARIGGIVRIGMFLAALAGALQFYHGLYAGVALIMWHAFFVGVAAYWAGQGARSWTLPLAALILVMVAKGSVGDAISATTAGALYLAFRTGRLTTALSKAPLQWLGMISYSLYLIHNTVTGSAFWVIGKIMPGGVASEAVQFLLVTCACLASAYALWWFIERPSHDLAKRIGARAF